MDKNSGAIFSELAYKMVESKDRAANIMKINKQLQDEGMKDWAIDPERSNKNISTFVNDKTKQVTIAHKGTDTSGVTSKKDVHADLLLGLGNEKSSKLFNKRLQQTEDIINSLPSDYKIYGSGHSLGGATLNFALANSKLARDRMEEARTYNAGASVMQSGIGKNRKAKLDQKVTHHRTSNDLVSASLLANNQFGRVKTQDTKVSKVTKYVPGHLKHIFNTGEALHAHGLSHFKKNKR